MQSGRAESETRFVSATDTTKRITLAQTLPEAVAFPDALLIARKAASLQAVLVAIAALSRPSQIVIFSTELPFAPAHLARKLRAADR